MGKEMERENGVCVQRKFQPQLAATKQSEGGMKHGWKAKPEAAKLPLPREGKVGINPEAQKYWAVLGIPLSGNLNYRERSFR